jgi:hypothetical protein
MTMMKFKYYDHRFVPMESSPFSWWIPEKTLFIDAGRN